MNSQKPTQSGEFITKKISAKKGRSKSIIIFFLTFIIGTTVACLVILAAMTANENKQPVKGTTYLFYEPNYELNILKIEDYMELERNVKFENPENGITYAIVNGNMDEVPTIMQESVGLLCEYVDYAINGESEKLNSLFSQEYIEAGGKTKMDFTMQQLYNIKITYVTSTGETVDGATTTSFDYWLEYMIRQNNGTFRNDMESDCIKKEYVRVTNRDGILGIDILAPYNTEPKQRAGVDDARIITAFGVSVVLVGGSCYLGYLLIKKKYE